VNVTIWHNPRCSKSRQTLALLQDTGVSPDIRIYLNNPPNLQEIETTLIMLNIPVIKMMRTGEAIFKDLGLTNTTSKADLINAMVKHPILIERPIVFANHKAVIGRPPTLALSILKDLAD